MGTPSAGKGSRIGSQHCIHIGAIIVRVKKFFDTTAAEALDAFQHFCCESFRVLGQDVGLDFAGTSPHEVAERAASPRHVDLLHVSLELLDASKVFAAMRADRSYSTANRTTLIMVVPDDVLAAEMLADAVGLRMVVKVRVEREEEPRVGKFLHCDAMLSLPDRTQGLLRGLSYLQMHRAAPDCHLGQIQSHWHLCPAEYYVGVVLSGDSCKPFCVSGGSTRWC